MKTFLLLASLTATILIGAANVEAPSADPGTGVNATNEVPPVAVPLPMLDPEPSVVPGVGAS